MTPCSPPVYCDPGKGRLECVRRTELPLRMAAETPALPLTIDGRADVGPDRFDLVRLQNAVPRWHVVLAADDRFDKAIVFIGTQTPEIERRPAGKGLQL